MAMSPEAMANAIYAEMETEYWPSTPLPPQAEDETKRYYKVLSKAIINYVKENLDVLPEGFNSLPGSFNVPSAGNVSGAGEITGIGKVE